WARFLPQYDVLRQLLADGLLGEVVEVAADHGQSFPLDPGHRMYAPELGGGALLDLGVYPVSYGEVVEVAADHGQSFQLDPGHRMYAPELGGGALLDLGVYPVSFAQMVLGELDELAVHGDLTETGVDAYVALLARGAHGGR